MGVANWFSGKLSGTRYDVYLFPVNGQEYQVWFNSPAALEWVKTGFAMTLAGAGVTWMNATTLLVSKAAVPVLAASLLGELPKLGFTVGGNE
jgi:hypothetical protein